MHFTLKIFTYSLFNFCQFSLIFSCRIYSWKLFRFPAESPRHFPRLFRSKSRIQLLGTFPPFIRIAQGERLATPRHYSRHFAEKFVQIHRCYQSARKSRNPAEAHAFQKRFRHLQTEMGMH